MSELALKIEDLSKLYRLGEVGTGTIREDLQRWWAKKWNLPDPFLKVGEENVRSSKGSSDFVWALRDINLEVPAGEVLGIIGANGAGKSTLLKLLSKITSPTTGSIKIRGRVASLLEVGTGFHPELTGRENIYLNGTILGMRKREVDAKLDEIVSFAGVERYLDTPVKRYSSGMTVRLGFAVAAHLEPDVLIVDEVLAVGDAEFQKKAVGKIQEVSGGTGRTVLFVSHNMSSILSLCERVILMENGRITMDGNAHEVVSRYQHGKRSNIESDELLSNTEHRKGDQSIVFTEVGFESPGHNGVAIPRVGEDLAIRLDFKVNSPQRYERLHVSVAIEDENGLTVSHLSNTVGAGREFKLAKSETEGSWYCTIRNLPLPPGTYYLHLFCSDLTRVFDHIEYARKLVVEDGDFFGTGRSQSRSSAIVYLDNSWT